VLWANTVLFSGHPLELLASESSSNNNNQLFIVGQRPSDVQKYDDKYFTNTLLAHHGCQHVAQSFLITKQGEHMDTSIVGLSLIESELTSRKMSFPLVVKPVRGRGSEGVTVVSSLKELNEVAESFLSDFKYGNYLILEEYLPGPELTITIMPPGSYQINDRTERKEKHWSLPPVRRFNHVNGVAPYNGTVAVTKNSVVLSATEIQSDPCVQQAMKDCETAAKVVNAVAPVRIDCRATQNESSNDNNNCSPNYYKLFDLNMKPNMTGAGRIGREDQDSLSCIAAREIGWNYSNLVQNMLNQAIPIATLLDKH